MARRRSHERFAVRPGVRYDLAPIGCRRFAGRRVIERATQVQLRPPLRGRTNHQLCAFPLRGTHQSPHRRPPPGKLVTSVTASATASAPASAPASTTASAPASAVAQRDDEGGDGDDEATRSRLLRRSGGTSSNMCKCAASLTARPYRRDQARRGDTRSHTSSSVSATSAALSEKLILLQGAVHQTSGPHGGRHLCEGRSRVREPASPLRPFFFN